MANDIEFFDNPLNGPGSLCANLETDCGQLNNMLSNVLGSIFVQLSTCLLALVCAFVSSWRMSLLTLLSVPFMIIASMIDSKAWMSEYDEGDRDDCSNIIQENISNIKTVRAMNTMEATLERFNTNLMKKRPIFKKLLVVSTTYGFGQSMTFYVMAYIFYMAGVVRDTYDEDFDKVFKALFCLMFAAFGAGFAAQ